MQKLVCTNKMLIKCRFIVTSHQIFSKKMVIIESFILKVILQNLKI